MPGQMDEDKYAYARCSDKTRRTRYGAHRSGRSGSRPQRAVSPEVSRRRRLAMYAGAAILGILVIVVGVVGYTFATATSKVAPPKAMRARLQEALSEPPVKKQEARHTYVLLLGNDRRPGEKRARTDTILLARLDKKTKGVLLVSIPRDTRTDVPGYGMTKINHASAYGGAPLAIETVKRFTGLPIHHYVQMDFQGFGKVVDALGGVDMYVDRPVDYGQGVVVPAGQQHLNGQQALSVVRNRRAHADGDLGRVRVQRQFLAAVARKMARPGNIARLPSVMNASANHIETDLSAAEMVALLRTYGAAAEGEIPGYTVTGSGRRIDGVYYMIPDPAKTKKLFEAVDAGATPK